jgi:hypothetical protein
VFPLPFLQGKRYYELIADSCMMLDLIVELVILPPPLELLVYVPNPEVYFPFDFLLFF